MQRLTRVVAVFLCIVTTSAFAATAIYWFWQAATDHEIANRGGFFFALVPVAFAIISFYLFRGAVRWLSK